MNTTERLATMRRTYEHATTPAEDAMAPAWSTHDFMTNHAPKLLDAVEKVLELHKPDNPFSYQFCSTCLEYDPSCPSGAAEWPCPTVTAIHDALEGK